MPAIPTYESDPYARELSVDVTGSGASEAGPYADVPDSVLFPGGGGQPEDRGTIGPALVTGVERQTAGFRLRLSTPVDPGPATLVLDWNRRFDHMQQHTAQHLLTAVASDQFGWDTTSFHLGARICAIELNVGVIDPTALTDLEDAVMERVRAAIPVRARRVSLDDYAALSVRTRGLPAGHTGDVRLIEIGDEDVTTCGGTHLARTSEIESIALLSTEAMRGGCRLHWLAGGRVRTRLGHLEDRGRALRAILGAADDELVDAARARGEQLKNAHKTVRRLEGLLGEARAREAAVLPGPVAHLHLDDASPSAVQGLARAFVPLAGTLVGVFTSQSPTGAFVVLAGGEAFDGDVDTLWKHLSGALEARGGGAGRIYQGRCASLEGLSSALTTLENRVHGSADSLGHQA